MKKGKSNSQAPFVNKYIEKYEQIRIQKFPEIKPERGNMLPQNHEKKLSIPPLIYNKNETLAIEDSY